MTERPLRFLVPGTGLRFRSGGLAVELQSARLCEGFAPRVQVVTYRVRETGRSFLDDLLQQEPPPGDALWVVSWGFDVPRLLRRLRGRPVLYHAHSSGYGFDLPPGVPVLAVSRNTLGHWGDRAPRQPLELVPNALDPAFLTPAPPEPAGGRPVQVLLQTRKSSHYLRRQLVPALRRRGVAVEEVGGWVPDLAALFRRSRVVLYDSADYWRSVGVSEGFGLPPLEALACGCVVFSSLNHALADSLDPGVVGWQIGAGTLEGDVQQIAAAVERPAAFLPDPDALGQLLARHSEAAVRERWRMALGRVNAHWDRMAAGARPLRAPGTGSLRWGRRWSRIQRRFRLGRAP